MVALLFDQNLSHRLPAKVADLFPASTHVRLIGLERGTDTSIWNYAKRASLVIVTQDSDFAERSKLFGAPPKVVWLRCGNATPERIEALLRRHAMAINELESPSTPSYLELF